MTPSQLTDSTLEPGAAPSATAPTRSHRIWDGVRRKVAGLGWRAAFIPLAVLLLCFFVGPLVIFLSYAFREGSAPWAQLGDAPVQAALVRTLVVALQITVISAAIAYIYASALVNSRGLFRILLLAAVIVPFLTSMLVRNYAWVIVLGNNGPINQVLEDLFGQGAGAQLVFNRTGVLIGMVHVLCPLFILPLYAVMTRIPSAYAQASRTLGANRVETFFTVTLPLTLPGAAAGAVLVFIQAIGFFITPAILGGIDDTMISQLMDQRLKTSVDISGAAVLATALIGAVLLIVVVFRVFYPIEYLFVQPGDTGRRTSIWRRLRRSSSAEAERSTARGLGGRPAVRAASGALSRLPWVRLTKIGAGLVALFLVLPVFVVIPASFTGELFLSFPPDTWGTIWYDQVLGDSEWRTAAEQSLWVGVVAAATCVIVGVPLAFGVVRSPFRERTKGLALLLATIPAITPIIVLALAVLVWFLETGLGGSVWTLGLAHALLGLPFLTLVLVAALRDFDTRLESASRSLGAGVTTTLRLITAPLLARAITAGLLFAFLASFDELLIARAVLLDSSDYTLPVRMFIGTNAEISPALAVVSTIILAITLSLLAIAVLLGRKPLTKGDK
jgi:putative spermidine/putrescine transport system permease protein